MTTYLYYLLTLIGIFHYFSSEENRLLTPIVNMPGTCQLQALISTKQTTFLFEVFTSQIPVASAGAHI